MKTPKGVKVFVVASGVVIDDYDLEGADLDKPMAKAALTEWIVDTVRPLAEEAAGDA